MQKYAQIFFLGNYVFLKARSLPQAVLSRKWLLLGTDDVCRWKSEHISYQVEAIVYIIIIVIFEWYVKIVVKYHLNITTIHLYNELKLSLNILKPV